MWLWAREQDEGEEGAEAAVEHRRPDLDERGARPPLPATRGYHEGVRDVDGVVHAQTYNQSHLFGSRFENSDPNPDPT